LDQIIRKILLTEVTTDERRLNIILDLYTNDLAKITCRQMGSVSEELFNFKQQNISSFGFRKFTDYIRAMQNEINAKVD
jgi:hypothetical protein